MSTVVPRGNRQDRVAEIRKERRAIERANEERKRYLELSEQKIELLQREVDRGSLRSWLHRVTAPR